MSTIGLENQQVPGLKPIVEATEQAVEASNKALETANRAEEKTEDAIKRVDVAIETADAASTAARTAQESLEENIGRIDEAVKDAAEAKEEVKSRADIKTIGDNLELTEDGVLNATGGGGGGNVDIPLNTYLSRFYRASFALGPNDNYQEERIEDALIPNSVSMWEWEGSAPLGTIYKPDPNSYDVGQEYADFRIMKIKNFDEEEQSPIGCFVFKSVPFAESKGIPQWGMQVRSEDDRYQGSVSFAKETSEYINKTPFGIGIKSIIDNGITKYRWEAAGIPITEYQELHVGDFAITDDNKMLVFDGEKFVTKEFVPYPSLKGSIATVYIATNADSFEMPDYEDGTKEHPFYHFTKLNAYRDANASILEVLGGELRAVTVDGSNGALFIDQFESHSDFSGPQIVADYVFAYCCDGNDYPKIVGFTGSVVNGGNFFKYVNLDNAKYGNSYSSISLSSCKNNRGINFGHFSFYDMKIDAYYCSGLQLKGQTKNPDGKCFGSGVNLSYSDNCDVGLSEFYYSGKGNYDTSINMSSCKDCKITINGEHSNTHLGLPSQSNHNKGCVVYLYYSVEFFVNVATFSTMLQDDTRLLVSELYGNQHTITLTGPGFSGSPDEEFFRSLNVMKGGVILKRSSDPYFVGVANIVTDPISLKSIDLEDSGIKALLSFQYAPDSE